MQRDGSPKEKKQKEMLEIKNTVTEMKNVFDGLISKLDMAEERMSKLEDISVESLKTKKQIEQRLKEKKNRISKDCGNMYAVGRSTIERKEQKKYLKYND